MKSYWIFNLLLLIMVQLVACEPVPPASILSVEDGWVRAMPPGMQMTAAYGVITNHDSDTIKISSFTSDSFTEVGLHLTKVENSVSSMESLPELTLSPGVSSVLEPGGMHLMLMNPTRDIKPGDTVGLTLNTAGSQQYQFFLPVEAR